MPPNKRENLSGTWSSRTHDRTQRQIARQEGMHKSHNDWVHTEINFAWQHQLVNIHSCMLFDALHQLLKGVFDHLIKWIKVVAGEKRLDRRIRLVPAYTKLKVFPNGFVQLSQISGMEQKSILRQFIPIVAPLLRKEPLVLLCTRAIVNLVMISLYPSQSDETLRYLRFYLAIVDISKLAFREIRHGHHFNFAKWHSMTHMCEFFRREWTGNDDMPYGGTTPIFAQTLCPENQ